MTTTQNFLARILTITVMVVCVMVLMRLTGGDHGTVNSYNPVDGHHTPTPTTQAERIKSMAEGWNGAVRFDTPYAALAPLTTVDAEKHDIGFDPDDDYWGLPRSEGVETVSGLCGACHSLAIVMQQRQTEEGWNYLFDWMIEKQGMAPIKGEMRDDIITYLSREFGQE